MTDRLLYFLARAVIALLQWLPLTMVARVGRLGGQAAYRLDRRHRSVALKNLTLCFGGEKSPEEIAELARENFRRIGENFACAARTAGMTWEELRPHVTFEGGEKLLAHRVRGRERSVVVAIGHFGNFELYARFGQFIPEFQCATTYRGLRQPSLDRLLQDLRERSGCLFFERRTGAADLRATMSRSNLILGLLVDQHAGAGGLRLPFFGHECSTNSAPAVLALRYNSALHTGFCYRVGLGRWRFEAGNEIPVRDEQGKARPVAGIMLDVNRAFETAIRRDPANWFWVHNRWKPVSRPAEATHQAP